MAFQVLPFKKPKSSMMKKLCPQFLNIISSSKSSKTKCFSVYASNWLGCLEILHIAPQKMLKSLECNKKKICPKKACFKIKTTAAKSKTKKFPSLYFGQKECVGERKLADVAFTISAEVGVAHDKCCHILDLP